MPPVAAGSGRQGRQGSSRGLQLWLPVALAGPDVAQTHVLYLWGCSNVPSSRVWQQIPCTGPQPTSPAPSAPRWQDGLCNGWLLWELLRNPSMKSTSEEQTVVTQPLPLPPGMIAIRQFEIQAEEILLSLAQIWQGKKILPP